MKTIVVETKKVTAHKTDGMPRIETIEQKIGPELTFNKFCKYLPNQNYQSVKVIRVLESSVDGKIKPQELKEVDKYQAMIDAALSSKLVPGKDVDYKALSEKQADAIEDMKKRLEALEKDNGSDISEDRQKLEAKAKELNITFRKTIGDDNLLKKIQEIEPEFKL